MSLKEFYNRIDEGEKDVANGNVISKSEIIKFSNKIKII